MVSAKNKGGDIKKTKQINKTKSTEEFPKEIFIPTQYVSNISKTNNKNIVPKDSQVFTVHFKGQPINITLDSGATVAIIKEEVPRRIGITFCKSKMKAVQADGRTKLNVSGNVMKTLSGAKLPSHSTRSSSMS